MSNNLSILGKIGQCSLPISSFLSDEVWSINLENETDCKFCQSQINRWVLPLGWIVSQMHIYKCKIYSLGSLRDINIETSILFIVVVYAVTESLVLEIKVLVDTPLHRNPCVGTLRLQSYKHRREKMPGHVNSSLAHITKENIIIHRLKYWITAMLSTFNLTFASFCDTNFLSQMPYLCVKLPGLFGFPWKANGEYEKSLPECHQADIQMVQQLGLEQTSATWVVDKRRRLLSPWTTYCMEIQQPVARGCCQEQLQGKSC